MRKAGLPFALLATLALLLVPLGASAQTTSSVSGTAVIRERVALPNNAEVTFQLVDVSRAGAAAIVLGEQKFTTSGKQAPFQFTLSYDPAKIQPNGTYAVQGNIRVDGRIRYTTTTQYRVISNGNPTSITITLESVAPLPTTGTGTTLLALVSALLALVLGLRWLRPRLAPTPARAG